jgi:hypothetical protein
MNAMFTRSAIPNGIFYAQGVNANVLFSETSWTKQPSIYDLRTNMDCRLEEELDGRDHSHPARYRITPNLPHAERRETSSLAS